MKRGLLGFPLLIFLIQAVSAQFFGGYGSFSVTGFFESIDSQTMTLGLLFLIFFALIFYALSKVFKNPYGEPNKGVAGTISLAISLMIVYGIYRSGFNIGDLVDIPSSFILVIILIFAVLIIWGLGRRRNEFGGKGFSLKGGLGGFFILFGLLLVLLALLTDIFYEKFTAVIIGIFLFLIGGLLLLVKRKRRLTGYTDYGPSPRGPGMFNRMRERRRDIRDIKHQQRLDYERRKAEDKYLRRLREEEEKRRRRGERIEGRPERRRQQKLRRDEGAAYKENERRQRIAEKQAYKGQEEFRRAEKAAYKENARRDEEIRRQKAIQDQKQQAQRQIQEINAEIADLQRRIPSSTVIQQAKFEGQIRAYEKRARKLGRFI